jgi:hypothetical protein
MLGEFHISRMVLVGLTRRTHSPSAQSRLKEWRSKDEDIFVRPVRVLQSEIRFQQDKSGRHVV